MTVSPEDRRNSMQPQRSEHIQHVCGTFEQAWRSGDQPHIEDCLSDTAGSERDTCLGDLLAVEFEYRRKLGQQLTVQDYIDRFPTQTQIVYAAFDNCLPKTVGYDTTAPTLIDERSRDEPVLSQFGLFSQPQFDAIEPQMHEELYAEGDYLFHQGDPGTSLMLLCDGSVEINTDDEWGKRHLIGRAIQGEVLGEMALLADEPRSANVIAATAVRVLVLPVEKFRRLAEEFPEISVMLTQVISKRVGTQHRDVLVGKSLERYRVQRRLGRGGMGVVYEAHDTKDGKRVALKMMSHQLVYDAAGHTQFQQEADIVESFQHENIVHMYRRFRAFHTAFIAMEFCDGETLQERIQRGPLAEAEARRVFGQVAAAVAYAHDRDIVHRDIKPDNIMVNSDGLVKLMDFGLAKPITSTNSALNGRIVGTPGYMSLEQLTGRSSAKECDYFSMGCVAYEMLTAKPICPAKSIPELLQRLTNWEVPDMKKECPDISDEFSQTVEGCLSKEAESRHLDFGVVASWVDGGC
ncbi:MAG: protein kinase [Planctomycetaceae bacterium]